MYPRETQLSQWLSTLFPKQTLSLQPLAGDASFRRYYRCYHPDGTYIVMDAPPEKDASCIPFSILSKALREKNINAPQIHHANFELGFLLLDDFGDTTYLEALKTENPQILYQQAIQTLIKIQHCHDINTTDFELPFFNAHFMATELENFDRWFIDELLGLSLNRSQRKILDDAYEHLLQSAVYQPQVVIHRDYHSRNLMFTPQNSPGVLDFQDAMIGPITYDLVSLLKDCYINWPESLVSTWVDYYFNEAKAGGLIDNQMTETQFSHAFDLMGIQRHLKAIFIFSRLHVKYERSSYLNDIPRTLQYIVTATGRYEEFEPLHWLLQTLISPKFSYPEPRSFRREMTPRTTVASLNSLSAEEKI